MPVNPVWSAARNGTTNQADTIIASGQINQFLDTHPTSFIYSGSILVDTHGSGSTPWQIFLGLFDYDQPFVMSGTAIGRIQIPVIPVGNGADLLVSLCVDNSGHPGSVINQTRIPANWITQFSAVTGLPGSDRSFNGTELSSSVLKPGQFNYWYLGQYQIYNWPFPYVGSSAAAAACYYSTASSGVMIQIGGVNSGTALDTVFTVPYDNAGNLIQSVTQATFPTTTDGSGKCCTVVDAASGSPVVVQVGGSTTYLGVSNSNVYTSTINTSVSPWQLASWSNQTAFPVNIQNQGMTGANGYVYVIGGSYSGTTYNTVYYAKVENAQITSWTQTTSLPQAMTLPFVAEVNGMMVVAGGNNSTGGNLNTTWYAPINSDGSLGSWISGPTAPNSSGNAFNATPFSNSNGMIAQIGLNENYLPADPLGEISSSWASQDGLSGIYTSFVDSGNGIVRAYVLNNGNYASGTFTLMCRLSVPMPTTGLTNGATYHIVMQQQGGDLTDYLISTYDWNTSLPATQYSSQNTYTWTNVPSLLTPGIPIRVFDPSTPGVPAVPLHTWSDNGAKISTIVSANSPDRRVLGLATATQSGTALNQNPGFEHSLIPWSVSGGTFTQSSTEAYEGGFSAQVTPSGSASTVYIQSELLPCQPGQSVNASGWFWFTNAVTTNASMSVYWYNAVGTFISSSSTNVSVAATTWTHLQNTFTAPSGAYQWTLNPALSGTPASSQVWYSDNVYGYWEYVGAQNSSVMEVNYGGVWPSPGLYPPLGTTVLA